jgi:hypothetical protein
LAYREISKRVNFATTAEAGADTGRMIAHRNVFTWTSSALTVDVPVGPARYYSLIYALPTEKTKWVFD